MLEITLNIFLPQSKFKLHRIFTFVSVTYYSQPVVSLHKPRHSLVDAAEAKEKLITLGFKAI